MRLDPYQPDVDPLIFLHRGTRECACDLIGWVLSTSVRLLAPERRINRKNTTKAKAMVAQCRAARIHGLAEILPSKVAIIAAPFPVVEARMDHDPNAQPGHGDNHPAERVEIWHQRRDG